MSGPVLLPPSFVRGEADLFAFLDKTPDTKRMLLALRTTASLLMASSGVTPPFMRMLLALSEVAVRRPFSSCTQALVMRYSDVVLTN